MSKECDRYHDEHCYTNHVPEEQYCIRCGQSSPGKIAFQMYMRQEMDKYYQSIKRKRKAVKNND